MPTFEFLYDFSSPYSYLAATQVEALAQRTGAQVVYRPIVLGGLFKAIGSGPPMKNSVKNVWMGKDLQRWAELYGVPFRFSPHFPLNTIAAMRLVLVDEKHAAQVTKEAYSAMWSEGLNLSEPQVISTIAARAGLDAKSAMAAIENQAIKDRLRANTDDAIARGVFGAPTFFVGDEMHWGNDRLQFVESALRRIA